MNPEAGFTLVELMIALVIFGMLSASIYGVVVLGAQSAGSGERITEQARRFRVATEVIVRQLRSTAPDKVQQEDGYLPLFIGAEESIEFITTVPQRRSVTGLGIVRYWMEDGVVRMSEVPLFLGGGLEGRGFEDSQFAIVTDLLFDVQSLRFAYRRTSQHTEDWASEWIAAEEDEFPSAVRVEVEPSLPEGPRWIHEIPIVIGAISELTGKPEGNGLRGGRRNNRKPFKVEDDFLDDDETTSSTLQSGGGGNSSRRGGRRNSGGGRRFRGGLGD